jgi:hypothetical protein
MWTSPTLLVAAKAKNFIIQPPRSALAHLHITQRRSQAQECGRQTALKFKITLVCGKSF